MRVCMAYVYMDLSMSVLWYVAYMFVAGRMFLWSASVACGLKTEQKGKLRRPRKEQKPLPSVPGLRFLMAEPGGHQCSQQLGHHEACLQKASACLSKGL